VPVCAVRASTSVSFGVEDNYSVPVSIASVLFELRCPAHLLPSNQRKEILMDGGHTLTSMSSISAIGLSTLYFMEFPAVSKHP
jgi:hypothetical protein